VKHEKVSSSCKVNSTKYFVRIYSNYLQMSIEILLLSSFSTKYFVENFQIKCTTKGESNTVYLNQEECRRPTQKFLQSFFISKPQIGQDVNIQHTRA